MILCHAAVACCTFLTRGSFTAELLFQLRLVHLQVFTEQPISDTQANSNIYGLRATIIVVISLF